MFDKYKNLFFAHRNITELLFPANCELDKFNVCFQAKKLLLNEKEELLKKKLILKLSDLFIHTIKT